MLVINMMMTARGCIEIVTGKTVLERRHLGWDPNVGRTALQRAGKRAEGTRNAEV